MTWAKIDDSFHMHPKTLAVGNAGAGLFARMLSWSCNHLTDGVVTGYAAVTLAGTDGPKLIDDLVRVGWLEPLPDGSYKIHDFDKYNPPASKEREKRRKNAEKQARFRAKATRSEAGTFASNQATQAVSNPDSNQVTNQVTAQVSSSVPVPVPHIIHTQSAREVMESTQTPPSPPATSSPASATRGTPQGDILAELQKHEVFEAIATEDLARQIAGDMGTCGKKLEWVLKAIDDAASKARTARTLGKPFNAETLADKVVTFVRNSRAPRGSGEPIADTRRGQGATIPTSDDPPPALRPERRPVPESYSKLVETGDTSGLPKIPPRPPVRLRRSFGTVDMDVDMPPTPTTSTTSPTPEPVES